jgi:xylulokinase
LKVLMDYVIGCDVGSQSTKAVLLSLKGELVGKVSESYAIDYPHPLWAEQPVERWTNALTQAIRLLLSMTGVKPESVHGLGVASQVDGVVPIDAFNHPLRSAIIWMDRRAVAQCETMRQTLGDDKVFHLTGLNLDASHVAPKIRWIAEHQPEIYERAVCFLLPGSYIGHYLTGELAVDYSNASSTLLLDVHAKAWSPEMCRWFGIEMDRLAPIGAATTPLASLRPAIAETLGLRSETLVVIGSGDEHAACLGAGVIQPGLIGDIAGTGEAVCATSHEPILDSTRLVETHCHADPGLWLLENPGFVSGGNYRWFRDNFSSLETRAAAELGLNPYQLLDAEAAQVPPGSGGVIFLPCLMGAMAPTWNQLARGTFFGFTLAHTRAHFTRAVLEGSAYAVRDTIDRLRTIGIELTEMRVMGGGAKSRLWNQIKADVTGLPVAVPKETETTALGAALLALIGIGTYASLQEACTHVVRIRERFEPRADAQTTYAELYQLYRQVYFALVPAFEQAAHIDAKISETKKSELEREGVKVIVAT